MWSISPTDLLRFRAQRLHVAPAVPAHEQLLDLLAQRLLGAMMQGDERAVTATYAGGNRPFVRSLSPHG